VLALAACSSSGSSSAGGSASATGSGGASGGSAAGGSSSSSTSSGGDILVGGVQDGNYTGIDQGFDARIARFNAAGGLNGQKVKLVTVLTDGSSTSTNLADMQTLVLKDHVFAVTPYSTEAFGPSSAALLEQQGVPSIGWAINPAACTGPNAFPVTGCVISPSYSNTFGWTQIADAVGKPVSQVKVALIGADNAGGAAGTSALAFSAKAAGADVVYAKASVPQGGTTDYTPYVQALMAASPNVIYLATEFAVSATLTAALHQAGYQGTILNPTAYVPGLLSSQKQLAAAIQGSLVMADFPPQEANSAVTRQIQADLKAAGQPTELGLGVEVGWFSADEFIAELQATAKAGAVTPANFVKTIHGGFTYNSGAGGLNDVTFPLLQQEPSTCGGYMRANANGTYSVAAPYACDPSKVVKVS
jgi:ABC-type branched-subunit amino acid transport system substrate-binding protein